MAFETTIDSIDVCGTEIFFFVSNEITSWRVKEFWSKEPETLEWILTFKPNEFFLDIGANIGLYSLFAACIRKVKVFAFEPESLNYAGLNRNIFLNRMSALIKAYPLALSDESSLNVLHLSQFIEGGACHNFKEKINFNHELLEPIFSQGCFSISLDELVMAHSIPVPHHIKIDVDGIEHKIIQGSMKTLDCPQVQSVLVELNTRLPEHIEVINLMLKKGFTYSLKQVEESLCQEGALAGVGNHIFFRK